MSIELFFEEKIRQTQAYITAVITNKIPYEELDTFILDTMSDWTLLGVTDEAPADAKEKVFWYVVHELSLFGAQSLHHDLYFRSEMITCVEFFAGKGSYPIDCIGWRPIA